MSQKFAIGSVRGLRPLAGIMLCAVAAGACTPTGPHGSESTSDRPVISGDPAHGDLRGLANAKYRVGRNALKHGDLEAALVLFQESHALAPGAAPPLKGRAEALDRLNRPEMAIHAYRQVIALDNGDVESRVALGKLFLKQNRPMEAAAHLNVALDAGENVPLRLMLAEALEKGGDRAGARRHYAAVLEADPGNGVARLAMTRLEGDAPVNAAARRDPMPAAESKNSSSEMAKKRDDASAETPMAPAVAPQPPETAPSEPAGEAMTLARDSDGPHADGAAAPTKMAGSPNAPERAEALAPMETAGSGADAMKTSKSEGPALPNEMPMQAASEDRMNTAEAMPPAAPAKTVTAPEAAEPAETAKAGETTDSNSSEAMTLASPAARAAAAERRAMETPESNVAAQPESENVTQASKGPMQDSSASNGDAGPASGASTSPPPTAKPATTGGYRVQLAAFRDSAQAERGKTRIAAAAGDLVPEVVVIERQNAGGAMPYRLSTPPLADRAAAETLCSTLRARYLDCMVVRDGVHRVQLAAFRHLERVQAYRRQLRASLGATMPRTEIVMDGGQEGAATVYRLWTQPLDSRSEAQELCRSLKAGGHDCFALQPDQGR